MFLIGPYSYPPGTMLSAAQRLGLTSGLVLCLDAGDAASYDGTSQTWTDTSGNGNHFYRGTGSGSDAADPAFTGTAGRQSSAEYFSSDGGDYFSPVGSPTFADTWHKDNATFTLAAWVYVASGVVTPPGLPLITTRGPVGGPFDPGVTLQISGLASTGRISLNYNNGSSTQACLPPTNDSIVEGTWMFAAVSFSEGSGASFVRANGFSELFSSDTYVSPSSAAKTAGPLIFAIATNSVAASGDRINSIAAWSTALSQAQVLSIYNATKGKFGL